MIEISQTDPKNFIRNCFGKFSKIDLIRVCGGSGYFGVVDGDIRCGIMFNLVLS